MQNGGYDIEGVIYHQHSNLLMKEILKMFHVDIPVIDLGCGHNFYVSVLNYAGYKASGCDIVDLGHKNFFTCDLTKPINKVGGIRNVISLEVGEHIPLECSFTYLDNVSSFGGDVIISWAIPGQDGIGHINCQTNQWVIEQMKHRKYRINESKTNSLRNSVIDCHCSWFKNTLMYFEPLSK